MNRLASRTVFQVSSSQPLVCSNTRGMASLKDLKTRMTAISAISKITASLKQLATAKLHGSQQALLKAKPFGPAVARGMQGSMPEELPYEIKSETVVPMAADKGLCGSVNSNIVKEMKKICAEKRTRFVYPVGGKPKAQLNKIYGQDYVASFTNTSKNAATFANAAQIADRVVKTETDRIIILHNEFKTMMVFTQAMHQIPSADHFLEHSDYSDFQVADDNVLRDLHSFTVASVIYNGLTHGYAVEIARRMMSMEGATKAANDMIVSLKLQYNRRRQAKITNELIEITSGAQAVAEMSKED